MRTVSEFYQWLRDENIPYRRLRTLVNTEKESIEMIHTEAGLIIVQEADGIFEIYIQADGQNNNINTLKAAVLEFVGQKKV